MTENLRLKAIELEDVPFLHSLFNNPDVIDYWYNEPYQTEHELEKYVKEEKTTSRLFLLTNDEEERIGLIGLFGIDRRHRHAEFGIAFDPNHQGKGYAGPATRLALDYAFLKLNLHKVYLTVAEENERAAYVYEKVGFQKEGKWIQHYFINGKYHDVWTMGILRENYITE